MCEGVCVRVCICVVCMCVSGCMSLVAICEVESFVLKSKQRILTMV